MQKYLLWNSEESSILITRNSKTIHTHKGKIEITQPIEYGDTLFTTKEKKYYVLNPTNEDVNIKINRKTNTFIIKDLSIILGYSSLNKNSIVLEIGTGSGAGTIFLSNFVQKVISIDINHHNITNAQKNIQKYGINEDILLILSNHNTLFFKENKFDAVIIDLPEPEIYADFCKTALKNGGDLIFAVPNIEQVKKCREILSQKKFTYFRTIETWVRKWLIRTNYSRPFHEMQAHSMFLTFCKKIK
ncbi:MAG: methyltransferase domain-containing protein [Candidatus Calescibacterium sp.]|nr:methyltransferase domain-containing protein [Candidatus Calescibacterium sp.]